jgi:hypothetical protein
MPEAKMAKIVDRINKKLRAIKENEALNLEHTPWKDPNSADYDRQKAEDALFHTIGPLTDSPRWVNNPWSSPGKPVPGFQPGGLAPQWTQDEIVMAYAGDPSLLFKGSKDNPYSPHYGNKGGAPLYRLARKVARYYSRDKDRSFIQDLYSNGFIPLVQLMQPGFDESRQPFISYITRNVQSAMEHGTGGEQRTNRAAGGDSNETGLRGIQSLVDETNSDAVRRAANEVKGKYRTVRSHDKHEDNPFGPFSSQYYQTAMAYADALDSEDEQEIQRARDQLFQLKDDIDDYSVGIRGASTGLGQAISTKDRVKKDEQGNIINPVNIASMDAPSKSGDETRTMAGNIEGDDGLDDSLADPETLRYVLDIAINYDLSSILKGTRYEAIAVGGPLNPNEFRYVIRAMGPIGTNYPGKGYMRERTEIPREARGWWQPGEDPEIEPIPSGGKWTSIWLRNGGQYQTPSQIAQEMTQEVREFNKLGIETKRTIKVKKKKGKTYEEVVSIASIIPPQKKAIKKLQIIATIHSDEIGLEGTNEVLENAQRAGILTEDIDKIDRLIIAETARFMVRRLKWGLVLEMAPKYKPAIVEKTLSTKERSNLPDSSFVFPKERKYPIHDKVHARNALSRVSQHGSTSEKKKVRAAIKAKYPDIGQDE